MKSALCRVSTAVCAVSSVLLATQIVAQESTGNWFEPLDHLSGEYVAEDTYVGDGDAQRGPAWQQGSCLAGRPPRDGVATGGERCIPAELGNAKISSKISGAVPSFCDQCFRMRA